MGTIAKDTPLAELTLRKYEPPTMAGRQLIRKLCLSLGLLQPGDSRDVMVDVLEVMLTAKEPISSKDVEERVVANRNKHSLPLQGIASSNVRRQLLRLRDLFIIEKTGTTYRMNENQSLGALFDEKIESYFLPSIVKRVKEYIREVEKAYPR
jgi:hypothetical protein